MEKAGHKVWISTSRPFHSVRYVELWLKKQGLSGHDFYPIGPRGSKSTLQCDAVVDDAPEQVRDSVLAGKRGFLYSRPWNINLHIKGATRILSLKEI